MSDDEGQERLALDVRQARAYGYARRLEGSRKPDGIGVWTPAEAAAEARRVFGLPEPEPVPEEARPRNVSPWMAVEPGCDAATAPRAAQREPSAEDQEIAKELAARLGKLGQLPGEKARALNKAIGRPEVAKDDEFVRQQCKAFLNSHLAEVEHSRQAERAANARKVKEKKPPPVCKGDEDCGCRRCLGLRIAERRKKGLSDRRTAELLGVDRKTVARIAGKRRGGQE